MTDDNSTWRPGGLGSRIYGQPIDQHAGQRQAMAHLAAGHPADARPRPERKADDLARSWRHDPHLEQLIAHPELLEQVRPETAARERMSLGRYRRAKAAAAEAGIDVRGPEAGRAGPPI